MNELEIQMIADLLTAEDDDERFDVYMNYGRRDKAQELVAKRIEEACANPWDTRSKKKSSLWTAVARVVMSTPHSRDPAPYLKKLAETFPSDK
jgi:hypothetical protein